MKKAISTILCVALMLSCICTTAFAAGEMYTVEADKTVAYAGDTVAFTVYMNDCAGIVGGVRNFEFTLSIPAGLTFVEGGFDAGFAAATGFQMPSFNPANKKASSFGILGAGGYTGGKVAILNFTCTVDAGNLGSKEVTLTNALYTVGTTRNTATVEAASVDVQVKPVPATGISLNKTSLELVAGGFETLTADVEPADTTDTVAWTSSDEAVATVVDGVVTAVAEGTATITATAGSKTATCAVTVTCNHKWIETEKFEKTPASCTNDAVYYKSCEYCETQGADTWTKTGTKLEHDLGSYVQEGDQHWKECRDCDYETDKENCSGGTATCTGKPVCSKCEFEYGTSLGHNYGTLIEQQNPVHTPTELAAGMKAHYKCSVCNKFFDEGKNEVTEASLVITAPVHEYDTQNWTADGSQHWHACSCGAKKDAADHKDDNTDNECDICKATICEHTGTIGTVEAQPAGCTTDGVKAHFKCSTCGTLFSDAEGKNTVTAADLRIPAAHTLGEWNAEDPAECGVPGTKGHYVCSVCTKYIDADKTTVIEELTIPALVHTGGKADCQNKAVCTLCEQPYGEIDPTNHVGGDMQYDANEHWGLCACGEQIDKEAHKGGAATCTDKAVCSVCSQPYGEIDATAHNFVGGVCSHNDKHVQFEKEPGAKVEDVIEGLVSADITVKQMVEGTLTTVDLTTLFKDGSISVAEGKLTYELLPAAPEGEYYVEIGEYVVMIVVEQAGGDYDRPSRPTLSNDAVKKVIAMIDELPSAKKVTLADQKDIEAARKAYNALSKANQAKVTNYEDLVEVEEALEALLAAPEMPEINNPFVDVADDVYYTDAVLWAVENGITSGTGADTFSPNAICTRAQVVTFLWRAAGSPAPKSTEMPFTDVEAGAYYAAAVQWAVENNITGGTSATTFDPNGECTRGQIVTFLWRAEGYPAAAAVNAFADVAADAYYNAPVLWAVANGITNGTSATTFSPADSCTRAQVVTFLYRAMAK